MENNIENILSDEEVTSATELLDLYVSATPKDKVRIIESLMLDKISAKDFAIWVDIVRIHLLNFSPQAMMLTFFPLFNDKLLEATVNNWKEIILEGEDHE